MLHLHLLLWLVDAPTGETMKKLLKSESFQQKISQFIGSNLRAHVPGLDSAESVKAIPVEKEIAFNCPPNPDSDDYDKLLQQFELRLTRAEQIHTCYLWCCLILDKHQQILCTSGNFSSCTSLHRSAQTWTHSSFNFSQLHRPAQHLKLLKTKKQSLLMKRAIIAANIELHSPLQQPMRLMKMEIGNRNGCTHILMVGSQAYSSTLDVTMMANSSQTVKTRKM